MFPMYGFDISLPPTEHIRPYLLCVVIKSVPRDVRFINTLAATVGAQHAAPLLPEGDALAQDLRKGHLELRPEPE